MSNFVVSARKYRPVRFDEVVGQQHVSQTLKNALQTDQLAHAFLFCGPRGVGKTTCARILAKVLNCQNRTEDFEPCNTCSSCESFNANASLNITELDAASNNSVDHIRALIEQVRFQPQQGQYKVFIIDEVHMLSQAAFNAFLKTLEEPPSYAIFILATTEKHKIIPTILSRCQIFDFKRIQIPAMVEHLEEICKQEGIEAEKDALHLIAQKADGALRDSLSIFDRMTAGAGKTITYDGVVENLNILDYDYYFRAVDYILTEDRAGLMLLFREVLNGGFEGDLFINGLAGHLRNLLVVKDPQTLPLLEVGERLRERYHQQSALTDTGLLLTALNLANDCDVEYRMANNKPLHVELCLLKMGSFRRGRVVEERLLENQETRDKNQDESREERLDEERAHRMRTRGTSVSSDVSSDGKSTSRATPSDASSDGKSTSKATSSDAPTDRLATDPKISSDALIGEELSKSNTATSTEIISETEVANDISNGGSTLNASGIAERIPPAEVQIKATTTSATMTMLDADAELAKLRADAQGQAASDAEPEINAEQLQAAWAAYLTTLGDTGPYYLLKDTVVEPYGSEIRARVGSQRSLAALRDDNSAMLYLREELKAPRLALRAELDESLRAARPQPKKRMTPKEKYLDMRAQNPMIDELRKRFDLRPEE
ncbi:MAG: DNA polymerase III subunit gamma/tau [Bacteroidota bacterium]